LIRLGDAWSAAVGQHRIKGAWQSIVSSISSANSGPVPTVSGSKVANAKWQLVFEDNFDTGSLDTSKWVALDGWTTNNVTTRASNVAVSNGNLVLTLADGSNGAEVISYPWAGATPNGYMLRVGDYLEAKIKFPGNGTDLYNWPAWWTSGPNWPSAGEHDIAEVLDNGDLTVNYHYGADYTTHTAANQRPNPTGYWGDAFHIYGIYRGATRADVYWDGNLVFSYPTYDNGQPESVIINVGASGGTVTAFGANSRVYVDYIRAWKLQ
jgi:hypothetical protein